MMTTPSIPENTPQQEHGMHTRRVILLLIVLCIFIALIGALYLNGQSLYTHGL